MKEPWREAPYTYVKQYYGVNPVIGSRVTMNTGPKAGIQSGVIVAKRAYDHYVHVRFDGSNFDVPVHPLDLIYGVEGQS